MVNNGGMYSTVMEKLAFEPQLDASNVTVSVQGNHDIVLLAGHVGSFAEKIIAEKAVKDLAGVRAVANDIEVNLSSPYKKSDVEIAKEVTRSLKSSFFVPEEDIKTVVKDGMVTLSGAVNWQYEKNNAFDAVHNLFGIKSVTNNIVVKPSTSIDIRTVKDKITKEFERHARIDASKIRIEATDKVITLKGAVSNFDEIEDAEHAAWSISGVKEVKNELKVDW